MEEPFSMRALHVSIQPYTENKNRAVQKFHTGCVILKWLKLKDEKARKKNLFNEKMVLFQENSWAFSVTSEFRKIVDGKF